MLLVPSERELVEKSTCMVPNTVTASLRPRSNLDI